MGDLLRPRDIIEGAAVPDHPGLYVLGCYDRRITFYAQQVRALSLVYALHDQGYLRANMRVAVVGGGAAGMTAAAATALVTQNDVVLFEQYQDLLHLQSAASLRSLDPHIFDWPEWDTGDPVADLPILDWVAGPAREVRTNVVFEFEGMVVALAPRLQKRTGQSVLAINPIDASFELVIERDGGPGDGPIGSRVEYRERFDLVFLAIGFGFEPLQTLQGIPNHSYWSDAGVPMEEFAGRVTPRFFVSGSGDGALIDLVAAGSAAFDHARMIRTIVDHTGINDVIEILRSIDVRARETEARGSRFDYFAAYDAEILGPIKAIGLLTAAIALLRPGVQLTLQTKHREMFVSSTSILNRVAAYLMMKACAAEARCSFSHVHCADVLVVPAPTDRTYEALYWLDCAGKIIGADSVIVRRGPNRADARGPFTALLHSYEVAHSAWVRLHDEAILVPRLSTQARTLFERRAREANVPLARHVQLARAALRIERAQIRPIQNGLRWSGTVSPQDISSAWSSDEARFEIVCPAPPAAFGPVATAIVRVATHAQHCKIVAAPGYWRRFAERLSSESAHAEGLRLPHIEDGNPSAVSRNPTVMQSQALAATLHLELDNWILRALDEHIGEYLATGRDPGRRVGFTTAQPLRQRMRVIWGEWRTSFNANGNLLARFLRLMVCAFDDDESIEIAQVLVGPAKLTSLVRGTTVALAIATAWQSIAPHTDRPGNLLRQRAGAQAWTGHGCAADHIDGKPMPLSAGSYMWQTQFVVLSVLGSIDIATQAEEAFSVTDAAQPGLSETAASGQIIMTIDAPFLAAVEAGSEALVHLLLSVENAHFAKLGKSIV